MQIKLFVILAAILMNSCRIEETSSTISLYGQWQFLASNHIKEAEILANKTIPWDTITVPGNWDTRKKHSQYVGKGYYQKTFKVPTTWKGSQVRIKFDAVYQTSKVWVNDNLAGKHIGGYTPFEFNITDLIKIGKVNTVIVMADNTYNRGAWWPWGGISRKVYLVKNDDERIVYQHISAIPDFKNKVVNFSISFKLENNSTKDQTIAIYTAIKKSGQVLQSRQLQATLKANSVNTSKLSFSEPLEKYDLWHFNHPNLYQLQSDLLLDGKVVDSKADRFGIRKLTAVGEQLYLNNKPVRMNGVNRIPDHPECGNTEPDRLVQKDMKDIKSLGANFSRLMHEPLATNLLDYCDSIGYMVIEEIPVWGKDDPQSFPNNSLTKQWLREMINRDFNHPCVVGWSVGNELRDSINDWENVTLTKAQYGYVNSMLDYVDELDTTRLKTYVSLSSYRKYANRSNEPYDKVDFLCINSYGDAVNAARQSHEKFPGKPIFFSEIGRSQIGPAPNARLSKKLVKDIRTLKQFNYVVGVSLWTYNDYRSKYKGTPPSGFREWGVVDAYRHKKAAWWQLKDLYQNWTNE